MTTKDETRFLYDQYLRLKFGDVDATLVICAECGAELWIPKNEKKDITCDVCGHFMEFGGDPDRDEGDDK